MNAPAPNNVSRQLLLDELESIYASLVADSIAMTEIDAALLSATNSPPRKAFHPIAAIPAVTQTATTPPTKKPLSPKTTKHMPISNDPNDTNLPEKSAEPQSLPSDQANLFDDPPSVNDNQALIESLIDQFLPQIKAELQKRLEETVKKQPNTEYQKTDKS